MPVYNGERYLAGAIESVLQQTHGDFEFIVVNDGSTDRTQEIIDRYAARDGRMKVISQTNAGQAESLNRALATANNEWVAILDADDICMPHRLETQLGALRREPLIRVLGSHAVQIDQWGAEQGTRAVGPGSVPEFRRLAEQGGQVVLVHPSVMMHRPTILALGGYDASFGAAADIELWSRASDEHVVVSLPETLIYYRTHPANMSMTRFFEQRLMMRWTLSRQQARRRGLPQPTLEEYQRPHSGWSKLQSLDHKRKDRGECLIARSALAWREGCRLRALLLRGAALALLPALVTTRVAGRRARKKKP
ncbi:MAG: glycosyltransferase [Rubrobacter sp.]|jgi:glycosyltransferase involved in cell wall biosynthesis|nr:glycosyltransferase [Rubrobacter sp.]